jgi:hypothetical protein
MTRKRYKCTPSDFKYFPTPRERKAIRTYLDHKSTHSTPCLKVEPREEGGDRYKFDHPIQRIALISLMEVLGSRDEDFVLGLVNQIVRAASQGERVNEGEINFMLAAVKGVRPQEEVEAMIAVQMAITQMLIARFANRLGCAENILQQDSAGRILSQLQNAFSLQVQTLKRYRNGGQQKIVVERIQSVSVVNVGETSDAPARGKAAGPPPRLADAGSVPMRMVNNSEEEARTSASSERSK